MMKKFVLSLLLVLSMVFAACGQSASTEEAGQPAENAVEEAAEEVPAESVEKPAEEASAQEEPAEEELEYVKLKYVNYGTKPESGNYDEVWAKINEMLLEDINCEIEVEFLGSSDANAMALKYAANEVFDMAYDASWFGHKDNAKANAYREITQEEIDKYLPLVKEQLPQSAWEEAKLNGKIYTIPNIAKEFTANQALLIRGDLREKYGLDPIETIEDYIEFCKVIAEAEPGIEAIGASADQMRAILFKQPNELETILGFDNAYYDLREAVENGNINVCYDVYTEELTEVYKTLNEMYKAGCWAEDAISATTDGGTKFENGLAASCVQNVPTLLGIGRRTEQAHSDWKIEIVSFQKENMTIYNSFLGNCTSINRNAENPERAMMAINLLYADPEYNYLVRYGIEGVNWEWDENGYKQSVPDQPEEVRYVSGCNWNFTNTVLQPKDAPPDPMYAVWKPGYDLLDNVFLNNAVDSPLAAFTFDSTGLESEMANIAAVRSEYTALGYGMLDDVEGTLEEYRNALDAAGLQTVLEELNKQLDAFIQ